MKTTVKSQKRMEEIQSEMRELSKVKVPTIVIVTDATGQSLDAAVLFIRAGDSIMDAVDEAALMGGIRNAHEQSTIKLAEEFNAEDHGLYWNHVYSG